MPSTIAIVGDHPTLRFAAQELARHLKLASGQKAEILRTGKADAPATFRLGLAADLGFKSPPKLGPNDDWVRIKPEGKGYVLSGSNPRSVLFAVYRYLRELGFRFIRPGKHGTVVPKVRSVIAKGLDVSDRPAYRYRSICIEGACSFEHVRDLIDWQAKNGMNGYFIQFEYGSIFFRRWYEHRDSKHMKPEPIDQARIVAGVEKLIDEIKKRGMSFERVGHGWTCAALGMSTETGWDQNTIDDVPAEKRDWLAEVNGKRELWGGIALNTQLNYGNPEVREAVVYAIVEYAGEHPEVDLLHFWLADGANNHDERPESASTRPSDFFVMMLNDLDAKLTARGLNTRIVFLIYVDLLWAPEREKLRNPERFVLMFAPITRRYIHSFLEAPKTGEQPKPFVRNKLDFPRDPRVNLQYLNDWRKDFKGDGFDFDYHAIWACFYDLTMYTIAEVLHKDIRGLAKMGLHGINSCQNQRMSFPTNLLMDVLAKTLWNPKRTFDDIVAESFGDAFGRDGAKVAAAMERISKLWRPFFEAVYIPDADTKRITQGRKNLKTIEAIADELLPVVQRNLKKYPSGAIHWSWRYLDWFLYWLGYLLPFYESYLHARPDTRERYEKAMDLAFKNEKVLHPVLDVFMCGGVLKWRVNEVENYLKTAGEKKQVGIF